jgi:Beta-galactosidase trimerisation domain/Cellulase (glycosyl hydrolase family 5)
VTVPFTTSGGRLLRDGSPFTALGVNYLPAQAGCRMWADWDLAAICADFRRIAASGLNSVRLFLVWRDMTLGPETVCPRAVRRVEQVVAAAADTGLACIVSLFTIWMNGQLLDLPWREGRSPWHDQAMLAAEEDLARQVARALRARRNMLAYDLGDELWNISPAAARTLSRAEVAAWQGRLAAVIRQEHPDALVLQANDASGVFATGPYGSDNSAALDLIGTHGFPTWAPGSIESTMSYKATSLAPFLAQVASAYGTPILDELGSYGTDEPTTAAYLRAASASALGNGAAGIFAWCWQDIASAADPYSERPAERQAGLNRLDGSAKPAMRDYASVARQASALATRRGRPATALYLPRRFRGLGGTYLDTAGSAVATFYAYLLLKRAHIDFNVTTDDLADRALIVCPSLAQVTVADLDCLTTAVEHGATAYISLGDHLHGYPGERLAGAVLTDFALPGRGNSAIRWDDERWSISWRTATGRPTTMRATTATVLGTYTDGSPALVRHRVGDGQVLFCNAPFEQQLDQPGRLTAAGWQRFYLRLAALAGVRPLIDCAEPDLEIIPVGTEAGPAVLAVNHGQHAVETTLVHLGPKEWAIADLAQERQTPMPSSPAR